MPDSCYPIYLNGRREMKITIRVERCLGGKIRLTTPTGQREFIRAEHWTRKVATEALDLFEHVYGFRRSAIRFYHVN